MSIMQTRLPDAGVDERPWALRIRLFMQGRMGELKMEARSFSRGGVAPR